MSGSIVVACKQALVTLLQGRPALSSVQVSYGWPGDDAVQPERIFCGRTRADHEQAALKAGRRFRNETATFEVVIQTLLLNKTPEDAEERALELGKEVEECVADNKTLGGVTGLQWAVISGWDMNSGQNEHGSVADLAYTLTYSARLT